MHDITEARSFMGAVELQWRRLARTYRAERIERSLSALYWWFDWG